MAGNNTYSQLSADVEAFIADETLPLAQKDLVAYQFADPLTLPKGRGLTYTATRYNRLPLPFAPLSEGVGPAQGESLTIQQVSATAQQWGDKVVITDVAEMTIKHPLFKKATELVAIQMAETLERNTFVALNALTQINYVNSRGSRAALQAGDTLDITTVTRTVAALRTLGAIRYNGDERPDMKRDVESGGARASENPRTMPHYAAILHPLVVADMRAISTISTAWSYSDINRLYNYELGEWSGMRFCESNMVPTWTGVAAITGTAGTSGSLATGTYYVQVTASDTQNQYESRVYQVSTGISVTGPNGSISVTLPSLTGFTFSVYIGTTTSPTNLALSASGPTSGPYAGQATQLAGGQTVVLTATGAAQTPPAAPATGVTVYPTYVLGKGAYGQVVLDDAKFTYLTAADKSDPLNQLRVIGWKTFYGTLIQNNQFAARIESSSAFSSSFG
ncbi:MAG: N4-gp56 family major capsid protein [Elusimicrobia bacterium]|nr:N4-gp56 family major capsid protein [Elusimicrobiota bacterium]